ncbi:MAG: hypothetical protein ACT4P6_15175 [Gemmatimonadaceae bacterium]
MLEVQGIMVEPDFAEWRRSFIYEWSNVRPATMGGRDSLLFTLPAIGASSVGARQIVPVGRRGGPRELVLMTDQELRLRIVNVDVAQHGLAQESIPWTLHVQRDCAISELTPVYTVAGSTALSNELRIPWASVRNIGGDSASACLHSLGIYRAINTPYAVQVVVNQTISWRLHPRAP